MLLNYFYIVPGATRFAAMFPVLSLVMITIAVILGILGNIRQDGKTFLAAIISILAGELTFLNNIDKLYTIVQGWSA